MANALEMKGEDTLGIGHGDACAGSTVLLIGHLLHGLQIVQASLKRGQALLQDRLSFLWFEILEERDARKKLGLVAGLLRRKITQQVDLHNFLSLTCAWAYHILG